MSAKGYYMYIRTTFSNKPGEKARLVSPLYSNSNQGYCLSWFYHMKGSNIGKLNVYVKAGDRQALLWSWGYNIGDIWNAAEISVPGYYTTTNFSIIFEGEAGSYYYGYIAIDDVFLSEGQCTSFGSCDFENYDLCTWMNVKDNKRDNFDWELGNGETITPNTGPSNDHTYGTIDGKYLYIETSYPSMPGDKAWLESTFFLPTPTYGICIDFWYSMYGNTIGELNLYVNASGSVSLLWWQQSNKGPGWFNGRVTIRSSVGYRILIEGIVGQGFAGDIAIDDLDFIEKSCEIVPSGAEPYLQPTTVTYKPTTPTRPPRSVYDCDFEIGFCNFTQPSNNEFNWIRLQGRNGINISGPVDVDHTTSTSQGWYVNADTFGKYPSRGGILNGPRMSGDRCLFFYYQLQSNIQFSLNVYAMNGINLGPVLWKKETSNGNFWRLGRVSLTASGTYQVAFELLINGITEKNDIFALDDIEFESGRCQDSAFVDLLCTFSDSTCGYTITNTTSPNFMWNLYTPNIQSDGSIIAGPISFDHTTDSLGSGYMYAENKDLRENLTSILTSFVYSNPSKFRCIEFYYYLVGSKGVRLNVTAYTPATRNKYSLFSRDYDHGNYWWKGEADIRLLSDYQILFEATSRNTYGLVGIDDVILKSDLCSSSNQVCDFESKDLCNWINEKGIDDFDWTLYSGSTPSSLTGPSVDHTTGTRNGTYIYIETSSPAKPNWRALLFSEPLNDDRKGCVYFWYHAYGADIGKLKVILKENSTNSQSLIWYLEGASGNVWLQGIAPFVSNDVHQIIFEGVVGKSFEGDIALDDILLTRGECNIQPENAKPQVFAPSFVNCNFESNFCNWINLLNGTTYNWSLSLGNVPSYALRPLIGASFTRGYAFIEPPVPTLAGSKATIISPSVPKPESAGYCIRFYYSLFGKQAGSLELIIQSADDPGRKTSLFIRNGTQSNDWYLTNVYINSETYNYDFKLSFDAIIGANFAGYMAIDEISLSSGSCPPSKICDFEIDFCGWTNLTGDFNWERANGATTTPNTGPNYDQ